jgi:triphosphoribosyl-dephospho-CoA synthase
VQSDTLIRRKCGDVAYHETACRAEYLIKAGFEPSPHHWQALAEFDAWLRADGHRRNPGTTADLIAAIWFIAIREKMVVPPTKLEILAHAVRIRKSG